LSDLLIENIKTVETPEAKYRYDAIILDPSQLPRHVVSLLESVIGKHYIPGPDCTVELEIKTIKVYTQIKISRNESEGGD